MKYAITVYFDEETTGKIQKLTDSTALSCGNTYMKDTKIPPHISLCSFEAADEEKIIGQFRALDGQIKAGDVFFASIGAFNPYVLFIAPVMNEYLFNACDILNSAYSITSLDMLYQPYNWVPHATIAYKLTDEQLKRAFCCLQGEFKAFGGRGTRLVLARCNPYFELSQLDLD